MRYALIPLHSHLIHKQVSACHLTYLIYMNEANEEWEELYTF